MSSYGLTKAKFLEEAELVDLRRMLQKDPLNKYCILISLALATGARAQELLNIKKEHLYQSTRSVQIYGLKGSNNREIPLPEDLFRTLFKYSETVKGSRVFPFSYSALTQAWHYIRPAKKKFHSLRHTFAIELYRRTKDIRLVQLALGHKSITNTEIYMSFVYSQDQMRKLLVG